MGAAGQPLSVSGEILAWLVLPPELHMIFRESSRKHVDSLRPLSDDRGISASSGGLDLNAGPP